jgi:hypothetical protein
VPHCCGARGGSDVEWQMGRWQHET